MEREEKIKAVKNKDKRYDGMIITGAPVENLDFADVDYWPELCAIREKYCVF